ncbi:MAG: ASKHA domain-containing protein, partial [Candidatus Aminicenantaceae bacterium]
GGFGQNLNIENAIRIGLLPDLERNRFHYLGNSSLQGAYLILRTDKNKRLVAEVAKRMTYVELNTEPGYMNEYTGSLFLPHTDMDLFPSVRDLLELDRSEPRS